MDTFLGVLSVFLLVATNGFFVAAEFALVGARRTRIAQLASEGYLIEYHREFDKSIYLKLLKSSDYLLVTGFDEGALSTLDAIMFGVTPIVTAQGYHLEQAGEMKLFSTFDELMQIATSLQTDVTKINQARHTLSDWSAFAVRHRDRWQSILDTGT